MRDAFLSPLVAVAVVLGACSSADVHASPEAAMRGFIDAGNRRDITGMRDVAVPPERLKRTLACPPDDHKIDAIEAIENARETMAERAGMSVRLISITDVSQQPFAPGDDYAGCRVIEPFEIHRIRMTVSADDGAGRRERSDEGDAIRLDGRWYLVIPTPSSRRSPG